MIEVTHANRWLNSIVVMADNLLHALGDESMHSGLFIYLSQLLILVTIASEPMSSNSATNQKSIFETFVWISRPTG